MIPSVNGYIIFCLFCTTAYLIGLLTFFGDNDGNKCDMTYMFEMPQYIRIANSFDKEFPKYGLYYYEEGRPRKTSPSFWGIPVIFVPGNAGSYRQVRSLATVALRKAISTKKPYHFDYFTIGLNEELSGLTGIYLNDQLDYVNRSIYSVLNLYKNEKFKPQTVILIGHSMGGVLIRKLAQFNSAPISIVITLASPHKRSPIILDYYVDTFYENADNATNPNVTFISLSGGYKDWLVPTTLTDLRDNSSLYTVTTNIPRAWVTADHKSISWCKQIVVALNRALFDCIDYKTRQVTESRDYRKTVFEHHLLHHSGTLVRLRDKYHQEMHFQNENSEWIETLSRQYSISLLKGTKKTKYHMIKLTNDPKHQILTLVALNLESSDWLYICGAHIPKESYKVCQSGTHLTHISWIAPSARYKRKMITINLHHLKANYSSDEYTHVIFKTAPTDDPVVFYVDIHANNDRSFDFTVPKLWDLTTRTLVDNTAEQALRYEITLNGLNHIIQSYNLWLYPVRCSGEVHHATATLHAPWGHEDTTKFFTESDKKAFNIRLYNSKPKNGKGAAVLKLTLDPMCQYQIKLQTSFLGTLSQLARFYTPLLVVNFTAVVLLILRTQMNSLDESGDCRSFFSSLKIGTTPYYVLPVTNMFAHVIDLFEGASYWKDWSILKEEGVNFFLLPYLMYFISVGLIWIFAVIIGVWVTICESTINKLFLKFINKTIPFTLVWSENMITALQKIPCAVAVVIILIGLNTCGALALALGTVFYFLKLTQMSQEYIEEVVFVAIKKIVMKLKDRNKKSNDEINKSYSINVDTSGLAFHGAIFMIWVLVTLINLPLVISWAHNYSYAPALKPDPSFLSGMVFSFCAIPLWHYDMPFKNRKWYKELSYFIVASALISLIFAPIHLYRLNYILSVTMIILVLHQLLSADKITQDTPTDNDHDNLTTESYDIIKTKLE